MSATDTARTWKIGDLARRARVSVRTLRHYDELGLLAPSARSDAGYRLYSAADVERLYRILALRSLGLSLEEIKRCLDEELDLVAVLRRHLAAVEQQLRAGEELRARLESLLDALASQPAPSADELLRTMEVMAMVERYYTKEQLETLEKRRNELGPEGMAAAQERWAKLIAAVEEERSKGTDPSDPRVLELAREWQELIDAFTGGDPGIAASLQRMYEEQGVEKASRGAVSSELMDYMHQAFAAMQRG